MRKESAKVLPLGKLDRQTPFIANIKFRNDLPELPCDPKLILAPLQPAKVAEFHITDIERSFKPEHLSGCYDPLSFPLIDVERYTCDGGQGQALAAADRAIIFNDSASKAGLAPWLHRTKYLQASAPAVAAAHVSEHNAGEHKGEQPNVDSVRAQIEETFSAAGRLAVGMRHPRQHDKRAVSVVPLVPDLQRWRHGYTVIDSKAEIVSELDLPGASVERRRELTSRAVLRQYALPTQDPAAPPTNFFAVLTPDEPATAQHGDEGARPRPTAEGEYTWVREFVTGLATVDTRKTYAVSLRDDRAVFVPIRHGAALGKRKRSDFAHIPIPAKVVVRRCSITEDEDSKAKELWGAVTDLPFDSSKIELPLARPPAS